MNNETGIRMLSQKLIAPVLCDYVYWVLCEAKKHNISTLYFLARDGYALLKIAEKICKEKQIPIECRYLYGSRTAFRVPTYHLLGDEMYELLFLGGYHVTIRSFFERAGIESDKWEAVLKEAGIETSADLGKELSNSEIRECREAFRRSDIFHTRVLERSRTEYPATIAYLKQEGVLDQKTIGIVDSGWTGSIQRSLRQLVRSAGSQSSIIGFYFGMYACPSDPEDGEYLSWYFSGRKGRKNKVLFCNNLFECFLSAPHGMTMRYQQTGDAVSPVLCDAPQGTQFKLIHDQIEGLMLGAGERINNGMTTARTDSERILRKIMGRPDRCIAEEYGRFAFCDDVTENYHFSLADQNQRDILKDYLIIPRVARKLTKRKNCKQQAELFWPYGTVAFVDNPAKRVWYWLNIYLWSCVKYILKKTT